MSLSLTLDMDVSFILEEMMAYLEQLLSIFV